MSNTVITLAKTPKLFKAGDRVLTPGGAGTVLWLRLSWKNQPHLSKPEDDDTEVACYTVALDGMNSSLNQIIYPASKVSELKEEETDGSAL